MLLKKQSIILGAAMLLAAGAVQATPINYSFTGISVGEYTGAGVPVVGNTIFDSVTAVSGTFTYDADAPYVASYPVPGYESAPFAGYYGAFSNMQMTVAGHSVAAATGLGLVGDNVVPTGTGIFLDALLGYGGFDVINGGFSGFSTDGWTLSSFALVFFSSPFSFSGQALTDEITSNVNLLEFFFSNSQGQVQKVRYGLSGLEQVVASVPAPATSWLVGLGLAGLLLQRRKNTKVS